MSDNEHEAKMAHPRMAAGALFFDEADRVLLVEPSYKDYREIPGGYVEQGESPLQACVREVHEELGIKPPIGPLLVVDWAPHPREGDKILYLFDGGRLSTDHRQRITLQADELRSYDFHPTDQLPTLTIPRLARRITAATHARANGVTLYLEHGESVADLVTGCRAIASGQERGQDRER
ncbi:NUDIX domain-containing protein [Streptomyces polyrhachis]|uniref:NUDIX domain-containing protein n=1 Tax=Streptomyces polyrhachis TaxID=1282885 RepID=A0ABW2GF34_9ACTN